MLPNTSKEEEDRTWEIALVKITGSGFISSWTTIKCARMVCPVSSVHVAPSWKKDFYIEEGNFQKG